MSEISDYIIKDSSQAGPRRRSIGYQNVGPWTVVCVCLHILQLLSFMFCVVSFHSLINTVPRRTLPLVTRRVLSLVTRRA